MSEPSIHHTESDPRLDLFEPAALSEKKSPAGELSEELRLKRRTWIACARLVVAGIALPWSYFLRPDAVIVWGGFLGYVAVGLATVAAIRKHKLPRWGMFAMMLLDVTMVALTCYAFGNQSTKIPIFFVIVSSGYLTLGEQRLGLSSLLFSLSSYLSIMLMEERGWIPQTPYPISSTGAEPLLFSFGVVTFAAVSMALVLTLTHKRLEEHVTNERRLLAAERQAHKKSHALQARLESAQRLEGIGRLAGGVAHDFNNLLTCILGYSRCLRDDPSISRGGRTDLEEIIRAAERAADLTSQLLAFSRKQMTKRQSIDLRRLTKEVERMLTRIIGEDIDFRVVHGEGDLMIQADPGQIEQVLVNLAANARDAMPEGGRLTVRTGLVHLDEEACYDHLDIQAGEYISIEVSDTGVGMDKATLSHIFEPFFTTKEVGKGTGLGLSTVYGIIKQNEGSISVTSRPGNGSVFRVYLPKDKKGSASEASHIYRACDRPKSNSGTILLVEDDTMVRKIAARILARRGGFRVIQAATPIEALDLASQHRAELSLLLTDVVMPQMTGPQLAARFEKLIPSVPILFMSGYTDQDLAEHGMTSDSDALIKKPFTADLLVSKVKQRIEAGPESLGQMLQRSA